MWRVVQLSSDATVLSYSSQTLPVRASKARPINSARSANCDCGKGTGVKGSCGREQARGESPGCAKRQTERLRKGRYPISQQPHTVDDESQPQRDWLARNKSAQRYHKHTMMHGVNAKATLPGPPV
jgi:hypothetical protein